MNVVDCARLPLRTGQAVALRKYPPRCCCLAVCGGFCRREESPGSTGQGAR